MITGAFNVGGMGSQIRAMSNLKPAFAELLRAVWNRFRISLSLQKEAYQCGQPGTCIQRSAPAEQH
ncbi:MAG: hypothetical protein WA140_13575, partial [Geobacteraceae bacterium]